MPRPKLTRDQILEIRTRYVKRDDRKRIKGNRAELAAEHGVTRCHISAITTGRIAQDPDWRDPERRFWRRVDRRGPNQCWPWTASRDKDDYGKVYFNGRIQRAHRVAWRFTFGEIPEGLDVCHQCDTPPCCNPAHLFLGTNRENLQDASRKGRMKGPGIQGELHYLSKLTVAHVLEIRSRYRKGEGAQLAREFGVTRSNIHAIANRKTWKHL